MSAFARKRLRYKCINRPTSEPLESRLLMAFGLTTTANSYTVDTGADLIFSISRTTASKADVGDLTSMLYSGTELEALYSATSRYSHYESGLSSNAVVTAITDPSGNWIEIACDDTGSSGTGVIQYYIARKGYDTIYMATYAPGPGIPAPGEMRFIAYTNHTVLTAAPAPSNLTGNTGAIESTDVFGFADGTTASKYYGEYEAINDPYHGLTGNGFGVFMNMGNRESSSGGPFFKDIDFQTTSSQSTELYNYMYSGHSQTENFRPGLQGPYALEFTDGSAPASVDYSFIDALNLTGSVPASGRGSLKGFVSNIPAGYVGTVALSNSTAQYWTQPDSSGNYIISGIKPGTYTETLYRNELAVGTQTVTISAAATTVTNITDTYYTPPEIFSIGTFDGTPTGFLNADKIQNMHPSDSRMTAWSDVNGLATYTVGSSALNTWPMIEWKEANPSNPIDIDDRIIFNLTSAQIASGPMTLRIGLTRAGGTSYNARPIISVNSGTYSAAPSSSVQPQSRGITVGNWRGNNVLYTYSISTSALLTGANTIDIEVASGSNDTDSYTGPWFVYDAIDLVTTSSLTNAPAVTTIAVSPNPANLITNQAQSFTAVAKDQFGNVIPANFTWSADNGSVDGAGDYVAPSSAGSATLTASSGSKSGSAGITISILSTINGTTGDDVIRLVRNGANLNVYLNSTTTALYSVPFSSLGALTVNGGDGNDIIILDFSGGATPIPSAGITVDGGNGANDRLALAGTTASDSASLATASLTVDGATVQFSNTESTELDPVSNQSNSLGSLAISSGASLNVSPAAASILTLSKIPTLWGVMNLGLSELVIPGGGAAAMTALSAYLAQGFNPHLGYWNGSSGINSSNAAADTQHLTALGINLDPNTGNVVVEYTYYGDADLNGVVNGADYQQIDDGFNTHLTQWSNGDFNYDGVVDGSDYSLLDNAFNQTLADSVSPSAIVTTPARIKLSAVAFSATSPAVFAGTTITAWDRYIESDDDSILSRLNKQ